MNILEIENLKTSFRSDEGIVQAVRGISFSVEQGEAIGIVGESGCGKSVSMLSVMGLLPATASVSAEEILFDGDDLLQKSKKEMRKLQGSRIGMIFQDPMTSLNPVFTIGNQIMEPLKIHRGLKGDAAKKEAIAILDSVGIPDPEKRLSQYPFEFSGGMRQRVMIAIAMSCNPALLIADEPTTALDVTIQAQILDLMQEIKEKSNTSIILITHDLGVIAGMCSRVLVMYGGLIVEEALVDDLFYHTAHPYTRGLIRSLPDGDGNGEKLIPIPGMPPDLLSPPQGCPFAARCKEAMQVCTQYMPELENISATHKAACWLNHPKAKGAKIHA